MAEAQGSAARLVEVALAEVGTIEGPKIMKQNTVSLQRQTFNHGAEVS